MINLETTFAGLRLKNPLIAGSSGLTNSMEKIKELDSAGAGAIVLKSLFEEQIESHSDKLVQIADYPEATDYINTYVKMNHVDKYLNLIRSAKKECAAPIIASINCYKPSRWVEFAKTIQDAGADALELNVFMLNAGEYEDSYLENSCTEVVKELKKIIHIPVVIKMAKYISNLPRLVSRLKALGAGGAVLFNRFYQLDIDIKNMEITSGPVFSNPSDFSETLRWTAIVSGRVPDFDIACSYGIHSWEDAVKGILAGAGAIQLCSMLYRQGTGAIGEILTCMEEWMQQNNYECINDFKGKLNHLNTKSPTLYERVQFMKYFSGYKE
ncbi:MAG: dihydroorotate dehydrogenase-like protein [Proteiniphilum sp.]|jgi:dihydroorotate dehydrogenase (fumarate)|nr:dihydroorotate dehydrogenase-like protein [Proteiniphilum sp.]